MRPVLLITAGTSGIGQAICRAGAVAGFDVAINFHRAEAAAEALAAKLRAGGANAIAVQADVTCEVGVVRMFARIDAELGPIAGLVNNAGGGKIATGPDGCLTVDATADIISAMFALNVTSAILCAREAIRRMARSRGGAGGSIVNISSDCARRGGPTHRLDGASGLVLYGAAKAALDGFTLSLATEVARDGIRVNAIRPATIRTAAHDVDGPDHYARMSSIIPMGRPGTPEEIADVAMFLLSEKASFMTGAFLDATGGR